MPDTEVGHVNTMALNIGVKYMYNTTCPLNCVQGDPVLVKSGGHMDCILWL